MQEDQQITHLLEKWKYGDRGAFDKAVGLVYKELRDLARHYLRKESAQHTMRPTALVNEAYLRLVGLQSLDWQNRSHFFAIAANTIRQILVDQARHRLAAKRDFGRRVVLQDVLLTDDGRSFEILQLDELLENLSEVDEIGANIVELRVFGGLTIAECARATDTSPATVKRHWRTAKAWLYRNLQND